MAELYCGDAACKSPVAPGSAAKLPIVCPACGAALYPEDELARRPRAAGESKRALLMRGAGRERMAVASLAELAGFSPEPTTDDTDARVDALLDRVATEPEPQRFGSQATLFLTLAIVALLVAGLVVWQLR